jgi:hypothetical protein
MQRLVVAEVRQDHTRRQVVERVDDLCAAREAEDPPETILEPVHKRAAEVVQSPAMPLGVDVRRRVCSQLWLILRR